MNSHCRFTRCRSFAKITLFILLAWLIPQGPATMESLWLENASTGGLSMGSFLTESLWAEEPDFTPAGILIEAEGFQDKGGWIVDQQFMDLERPGDAGSAILLAHGAGEKVANAKTTVRLPKAGKYFVFARTRNWASPWIPEGVSEEELARDWAPGKFRLILNGVPSETILGIHGKQWAWQPAGSVDVPADGTLNIEIQDLTSFDGRVDALYITPLETCDLPDDPLLLVEIRRQALGLPQNPPNAREKEYDLVVAGGGIAGCCAAVAAARLGLDVALIQDRPVLGGNGSTEVRVHLNGEVRLPPYPNVGNLTYIMGPYGGGNAREAAHYKDRNRLEICQAEKTLDVYLSTHVYAVEKDRNRIVAAYGKNIETGVETRFAAKLFADCTGDGTLGFLAGADWAQWSEARSEYDEPDAPEQRRMLTMGASIQWYSSETPNPVAFPKLPWAHQFTPENFQPLFRGDWNWETGLTYDQIYDFERIRDNGLRAAYGHWAYMKNAEGPWSAAVENRKLGWVAFIAGKRESRRLLGDVVLREQDVTGNRQWPDACVPCTWSIDLHYPQPENSRDFPGNEFRSICVASDKPAAYAIPYRTLYSRNIENLFMAGRDISVTHIALGTTRVMRTCGMMGEVVGMAAAVCRRNDILPRAVYTQKLDELIQLMQQGVAPVPNALNPIQTPVWLKNAGENLARQATATASNEHTSGQYPPQNAIDGIADTTSNASRWVCSELNVDSTEKWLELRWNQPVTFNALRVVSGQRGTAKDGDKTVSLPRDAVDNFVLQVFQDNHWVDVPQSAVRDNPYCDIGVTFPAITTDRVRLFINTPGYLARIWEVELYHLPEVK